MSRSSRQPPRRLGELPDQPANPPHVQNPYRVRMTREPQRYIEPDEIYDDLRRGPRTSIPPNFPYTWTPVNGLGSVERMQSMRVGSLFSDLVDTGTSLIKGGVNQAKDVAQGKGEQAVEDLLGTEGGKALLTKVRAEAADGVTKVVKEQAPHLMLLAVAGGAVGGAVAFKLGKLGLLAALGVAGWSAYQLLNIKTDPPKK